jgi:adenine deaminase
VKVAIANGVAPLTAIQMTTLNTAEHFGVSRDVGMIAPCRFADILLVDDLGQLDPGMVIAQGKVVAEKGRLLMDLPPYPYPEWAIHSVHLARPLQAEDFHLRAPDVNPAHSDHLVANVIGVIENQAPTRHLKVNVEVQSGEVGVDIGRDLAKVALVERHRGTGQVQVGLVHGFGLTAPCAIGSTVAHDSHHMIVVGTDESCMAIASNELSKTGGGQVVVKNGEVIGRVELPIAGLMSNERADVVARKAASVLEGLRACGCNLNNPNMQLSLLALVVIPELRISDLGLVDVTRFELIPIFEDQE